MHYSKIQIMGQRNEPKFLPSSSCSRTLKFLTLTFVSLLSIPANVCQEEDNNEVFTKMCRPFFPHVKALPVEEAERLELEKCFTLRAFPLGMSNHVHISFRQWPFISHDHCKDFVAKNVSIGAYNKHMWPYGRWLASAPKEQQLDSCFNEDDLIADVRGNVQNCPSEFIQLDIVQRDPVKTIAQIPSGINIFKFNLHGSEKNHGGVCAVWTYKLDHNFKVRVASEMGGLKNAKDYFKRFSVTFLAELYVEPSEELKMEPFLYSVQTNTWNFDGANEKDHHKTRCHSPSLKHRNFHSQMFTQNIELPAPLQQLILSLVANPPRYDDEEDDRSNSNHDKDMLEVSGENDRSTSRSQKNSGEATSNAEPLTSEPKQSIDEASSEASESSPEAAAEVKSDVASDQIANDMSINVTVHEYTA